MTKFLDDSAWLCAEKLKKHGFETQKLKNKIKKIKIKINTKIKPKVQQIIKQSRKIQFFRALCEMHMWTLIAFVLLLQRAAAMSSLEVTYQGNALAAETPAGDSDIPGLRL